MTEYMYKDTAGRLSKLVAAELSRMEAIYNFDYGDEFEIACCHLIRVLLPTKYGICRGHIVTRDNRQAGDDLIIYDRDATPTLRMLPEDDYSRKEFIPIESVYAYIEAKHTLSLGEDGTYAKALAQIAAAKSLPRKDRRHSELFPGFSTDVPITLGDLVHPERANPMYGAIFSRRLELGGNGVSPLQSPPGDPKLLPDLIVAGPDYVGIPAIIEEASAKLRVFRDTGDRLLVKKPTGRAFAIGLLVLLSSLYFIDLGVVNWRAVFLEQLNAG